MLLDARVNMSRTETQMPLLGMTGPEGPMPLLDMKGPDGPMSLMRSHENKQMSHLCRVCGQRAAGFHFGVFTCEGCKSFFGRTYNNLSAVYGCKNGGTCIINMETRTSCKACRLKKCLMVGMSKNGSRYGRRSNWFKIHCMLEEQSNQSSQHENEDILHFNKSDIFKSSLVDMYNSSNITLPFPSSKFKPQGNIFDIDNELTSMQMKMMNKQLEKQDTTMNQTANTFNFINQINSQMFSPHLGFSPLYISQLLTKPSSHMNPSDLHSSPSVSPSTTSVAPLTPPLELDETHLTNQTSPPVISPLLPLQFQEELMQSLHIQRLFWNRKRNCDSFYEENHHGIVNPAVQMANQTAEQNSPIDLSVKRPRHIEWSTPETAFPDSPPSTPVQTTPAVDDTPIDLSIRT